MGEEASSGRGRLSAIDYLKAAAIIAVVFTHAGRSVLGPRATEWDVILCSVWVKFHVPSFLFASGFLYARTRPVDLARVGSRWLRVLVPYAVASTLVLLLGLSPARDLGDVAFQFATASSLGVYYYIFLFAIFVPLIWPLSRLPRQAAVVGALACAAFLVAAAFQPRLHTYDFFWTIRNPLEFFSLGFFFSGWAAALYLPELSAFYERHRRPIQGLVALGVVVGIALNTGKIVRDLSVANRVMYTFSVIGAVTLLTRHRAVGPVVRFLSEASLTLYLYHRIFQLLLYPTVDAWHPAVRIGVQVLAGLGGASLVALAGQRLLGRGRSRLLLGV